MKQENTVRSTYQCQLETLTPVHIGSGDKYVANFDFFYESSRGHDSSRGQVYVFDRNRLLKQVAQAGEKTIESFFQAVEDARLDKWVKNKKHGIRLEKTLLHRFSCDRKPREISVQMRTGTGQPLLAGSSLKGALRTAVIGRLSFEEENRSVEQTKKDLQTGAGVNLKFADSGICGELLGRDAQNNLMRTLAVSDFSFPKDDIKLQRAVLTRLTGKSNMKIKFPLLVEKIPEKSRAVGQVAFDEFLGEHGQNTMGFRTRLSLPWLIEAIRMNTGKTIASELAFLQDIHGPHVPELKKFYRQLQEHVRGLGENEIILQLAWGSGWKGMTGDLLDLEDMTPRLQEKLRKKLQLAPKYSGFPFPKSRRIAVTDNGAIPFGWIKLIFTSKEEIRRQEADRLRKAQEKEAIRIKQEESLAKEKEQWEQMSEIERDIAIVLGKDIARTQAPGKDGLRDVWPKLDNLELVEQKTVARAFHELWSGQEKLWRKKLCTTGQWSKVERIVTLLDIAHPDISKADPEIKQLIDRIKELQDWSAYDSSGINPEKLPLKAAEQLEKRFKDWGCDNKKAKKNKQQAWKALKIHLRGLRRGH